MKITEVRDGFVKVESAEKIAISSFLEVKGMEKRYIAQVVRSKSNGTGYNVYAKLLFIYDGALRKYDKTMPDINASVNPFSFEKINNSFSYTQPIVAGKFVSERENILLDTDSLCNTTIASIDNPVMNDIVVQNFAKQFQQKGRTIIIDMLGMLNCEKYTAGKDFRLPLNLESLKFIYEDCLNDATSDSKELIKEIFADLANYAKEVKFLPFTTLKTIVEDMVEKSHIFKLLVLKNKLVKFEKEGYFASNVADADNLSSILKSNFAVIDMSKIDGSFQNRYLEVILSELNASDAKTFVILEASNAISKKNIKSILTSERLKSIFVTHSRFKYLADLKSVFKNAILENTMANRDIFSLYSFFLESMENDNYLIVGDTTNYVPLLSFAEKCDTEVKKLPQDSVSEEVKSVGYDSQITDTTSEYPTYENGVDENEASESIFTDEENEDKDDDSDVETEDLSDSFEEEIEETDEELTISEEDTDEPDLIEDAYIDESEPDEDNSEGDDIEEMPESANDIGLTVVHTDIPETSEEEDNSELTSPITEYKTEVLQESVENLSDIDIPADLTDDFDEIENDESIAEESIDESNQLSESSETESVEEIPVIPLEEQGADIGDFEELETSEITDDDILVDLNEDSEDSVDTEEESDMSADELDKRIVEDVDKVFSTIKEEGISESDLDLIDTLNGPEISDDELSEESFFSQEDAETLQNFDDSEDENGFLEPLEEISDSAENIKEEKEVLETRESSTTTVPIYEASIPEEDKVISDPIEQGDTVVHAKYGSGVVEKMIKYGNKNLYSINFDNVGRRLLDPTLTEIKKA